MRSDYAIGVFDSGIGGVSVLQSLKQLLPKESFYYIADSLYAPYGEKTDGFISKRCVKIVDFLISKDVKAIVIACNTATAAAVHVLRERYSIPIIGIEPGIKPATLQSKTGYIGVMATTSTLKSTKFSKLLHEYAQPNNVIVQKCPGLVDLIENGQFDDVKLVSLLHGYLEMLKLHAVDTIVLGCTHYYFLKPAIERYFDNNIDIIDVRPAVGMQLKRLLEVKGLLVVDSSVSVDQFWSSGHIKNNQPVFNALMDEAIDLRQLPELM